MKYLWLLKLACAAAYIVCAALLSMQKPELCLSYENECSLEDTLHVSSAYRLPVCSKDGDPCLTQGDYNRCMFLNTTALSLDKLYEAESPNSVLVLNSLILASFMLLLSLLFDGDRTAEAESQSFASRKENIWMHWVIFALAIALIAISSFMLDGKKRNSSASCTAGNEDGCAALGDCEVEALGVEDAVTTKQLTVAGLVFVVVFTIVFMIPFDESELSDFFSCPPRLCRYRPRRAVVPEHLAHTADGHKADSAEMVTIDSSTECAICLELVKCSAETSPRLAPRALPCGHVFHCGCIEQWAARSGRTDTDDVHSQCPLCRTPV